MEEKKIWYLCDGEKPDCKKNHCYKNTDDKPCRHTADIEHALNFKKKKHGNHTSYWENCRDKASDAAEKNYGMKSDKNLRISFNPFLKRFSM